MLVTNTRRVGVFIDVQNMYYSARNLFNQKVNFENIVKNAVGEQQLIRAIAYTISTPQGDESAFFDALRNSGIEVKSKELLDYGATKKGDWDVGVTVDIIRMLDMLDVVVLVSGDGDFTPLGDFVRSRGRIFHVASFRESTSGMLVGATDVYTNLSDDKKKYLIPERRGKSQTSTNKTVKSQPIVKIKEEEIDDIEESRTRRLTF
ncbi:MAG: NYN domain-containing protein [Candidatus Uhrbacteria bacterium]|nr:NYN domain-containing protein [Candidatus Uhrbacteria bacterium]